MANAFNERPVTITNAYDGTNIPAIVVEPDSSPERIYFLLHGLTTDKHEYLDFYVQVAHRLAVAGIGSIRFDFRGHGESEAPSSEFTILNSASDVLACSRWIRKEYPNAEQRVFGTSFGAGAGIVAVAAMPNWFSELRLLAPILNLDELYIAPIHPARESYREFRATTLGRAERRVIDDRRSFGHMNALEFVSINLVRLVRRQYASTVVMHGTADTIIPYDGTVKSLAGSKIRLVTFEGMDHGYIDIEDPDGKGPKSRENLDQIIAELI